MLRIWHNWERCELNFLLWLRLAVYSITIQKNQRMSFFEYKNTILPFMRKAQKLNFLSVIKVLTDMRKWSFSWTAAAAAAKSLQSCPALCNPVYSSPPDSSVPGILQARMLEWVENSFSNACMHACMHAKSLQSRPTLRPYGQQPTRLLCPQDSLGKNTGVGCHFLLFLIS